MEVRRIMSVPPVTIADDATFDDALRSMEEHHVRHLPVMADGKLVGVLSDRDLLHETGWLPARVRAMSSNPDDPSRRVRDLMSSPVMTVSPSDSVVTVTVEAVVQKIGCLPVVEDGEVVGVVSEIDLMKAFCKGCKIPSLEAELDAPTERYMSRDVMSIDTHATLGEARRTLDELDVRHLPVVAEGRLAGMISDRDVHRALGRGRAEDYRIDEVMSLDPMTVRPETRLSEAVEQMVNETIGALPVIADEELVGILTTTDVLDHCMNHLRESDAQQA